ncbi:MAG TPA: hypothetical protein VJ863_09850 [Sphaerochaeta sp.]|nr:hypothetical protein [Sphaerochaeta sp.]
MRIRVFLLALVGVLSVCPPLFALEEIPFSVGIFSLQDDAALLSSQIEEAGTTYANQFLVPSDAYKQYLIARHEKIDDLAKLKEISSAYASKSEKDLLKAREIQVEPEMILAERLEVTYSQIPYEKGYASLLTLYPDARSFYASQQGLDALLLIKKTKISSNDRIRLYWYDLFSDTTTVIFDQVVVGQQAPLEMQEKMGAALLAKSAGPEYGLLVFDNFRSSLSLTVNGEPYQLDGEQTLFSPGEYTLSFSEEGFVSKQITLTIEENTITHVPSRLERVAVGDIHLSSTIGKVAWFVDGQEEGISCDLSIGSTRVPLVIVAQKEGFASKTLQVQKPVQEISVSLQPEWMTRSALVQEEQRGFYKSLRNTMLIFGLYVASTTLSQTFDVANPLAQSLQVATSGFALVSTMHTLMNLASYVALAGSGVR